jgi:hypothetical protein
MNKLKAVLTVAFEILWPLATASRKGKVGTMLLTAGMALALALSYMGESQELVTVQAGLECPPCVCAQVAPVRDVGCGVGR